MNATTLPLADIVWAPRAGVARAVRAVTLVVAGSALLAISARIQIPFIPVHFTMQTAVVLAIGLTFGPGLATATMSTYLAEGTAGLPVFQDGGWAAYLFTHPSAGFLWGMLVAIVLMGWLARRGWDTTVPRAVVAMVAGTVVIFGIGMTWLAVQFDWGTAVTGGLKPFVFSEPLKIALVAAALPSARRLVDRTESR